MSTNLADCAEVSVKTENFVGLEISGLAVDREDAEVIGDTGIVG